MNQSILSVRISSEDKTKFENFCKETGLNVSTAINIFIKTVLRENKIPFEISLTNDEYIYKKLLEVDKKIDNEKQYSEEETMEKIMNN